MLTMFLTKPILKGVFILSMLLINIWQISGPCTSRFLNYGVMIEVSSESPGSLLAPTLTVARIGPDLV